jgi:ATP-dependent DNA ligase
VVNEQHNAGQPRRGRRLDELGFEGIVSKRLAAPYRSGASRDWIKVKNPDSPAMVRHREGRW